MLARHREQGLPAQAERLLRLVRFQPAPGQAQRGERPVQDLLGGVQPQGTGKRLLRAVVVGERDQRVALVEQQLPLGVPECAVAALRCGQPGQRLMRAVEQAGGAPQSLRPGRATAPGCHPGQRPGLQDGGHRRRYAHVAAGQARGGPGQRHRLGRVPVVERDQRLAHRHPGPELPVAGLVSRRPRGAEERPGQSLMADIDHDHARQPGKLCREPAQPLAEVQRLPVLAHPAHVTEVQQDVAQQPQRRDGQVLIAVPRRRLLPLVQHRRRHGPADQGVIHPAPDPLHGAEELAVHPGRRVRDHAQLGPAEHVVVILCLTRIRRETGPFLGPAADRTRQAPGIGRARVVPVSGRQRRNLGGGPGPRSGPVRPPAEALAVVPQVRRLEPVHRAQVVQVLRTRALLPALVGGQQRLAEPWGRPALAGVPGADLGDDVGERDPERQAVGADPAGPREGGAPVVDLRRDLRGGKPADQPGGTGLAGDPDLLPRLSPGRPGRHLGAGRRRGQGQRRRR